MADEVTLEVYGLKIKAEENQAMALDEIPDIENNQDFDLILIGTVVTMRSFNFEELKRTLNQIWAVSRGCFFGL